MIRFGYPGGGPFSNDVRHGPHGGGWLGLGRQQQREAREKQRRRAHHGLRSRHRTSSQRMGRKHDARTRSLTRARTTH